MKNLGKLLLLVCMAVLIVGLMTPAAVQAGKGAVKLGLFERLEGDGAREAGNGPKVGWAIANTTADGRLIVQVHLDSGAGNTAFDVYVKVNWKWFQVDVDQLTTNAQCKGNAHVVLDLAEYPNDTDPIVVQVVVKPQGSSAIIGYSSDGEEVPLKK